MDEYRKGMIMKRKNEEKLWIFMGLKTTAFLSLLYLTNYTYIYLNMSISRWYKYKGELTLNLINDLNIELISLMDGWTYSRFPLPFIAQRISIFIKTFPISRD